MGPQSARSYPGRRMDKPAGPKAQRAKQEIDYGRRGKGYVFGAFRPATGEAFTAPYAGRTTANWVDFLGAVEGWINADVARVYAVMDNLNVHSATDVLLFALAHPRWEFVFQPKYAASLNLIEPWWKILRFLGSWPILMIGAGSPNKGNEPSLASFAGQDLRPARNLEPRSSSIRDHLHPSVASDDGLLPALRQAVQACPQPIRAHAHRPALGRVRRRHSAAGAPP